jgi:hypothetical protein
LAETNSDQSLATLLILARSQSPGTCDLALQRDTNTYRMSGSCGSDALDYQVAVTDWTSFLKLRGALNVLRGRHALTSCARVANSAMDHLSGALDPASLDDSARRKILEDLTTAQALLPDGGAK